MKLPAFQFYPADWRKDPGVQALSFFDRGVWFEILCLMHESTQRGKLLLNGRPMPDDALARLLGLDKQALSRTLTVLLDYGVASRDEQGALMNRRMIRDEEIRKIRQESGSKGGNPALLKQNGTKTENEVKQNPTPSSSSSSSPSFLTSEVRDARQYEYPIRDLIETFPTIDITDAQIGMIQSAVTVDDKDAWKATLETYKANYNPATKSYLPEKVGNLLNVFRSHKGKIARQVAKVTPAAAKVGAHEQPEPVEVDDEFCPRCKLDTCFEHGKVRQEAA